MRRTADDQVTMCFMCNRGKWSQINGDRFYHASVIIPDVTTPSKVLPRQHFGRTSLRRTILCEGGHMTTSLSSYSAMSATARKLDPIDPEGAEHRVQGSTMEATSSTESDVRVYPENALTFLRADLRRIEPYRRAPGDMMIPSGARTRPEPSAPGDRRTSVDDDCDSILRAEESLPIWERQPLVA